LLLMLLACTLLAGAANAHQRGRSFCSVRTVPGGIDVTLETAGVHLVPILGLSEKKPSDGELLGARARLMQQIEDRVQPRTPAGPCRFRAGALELVTLDGERGVSATTHFDCEPGPVTLRNTFGMDVEPASEVVCVIDGAAWVFRIGLEERAVGTPPTLGDTFVSFVRSGAGHVISGIDHVLFVILLLLAAARAAKSERFAVGIRQVTLIVTGFTLGHSVTLIAAGLSLVRVDARLTESLIALSIVAIGLENVLRTRPRMRMLAATLFGLVHGFGFASVLADTELPARGQVGALICFNIGIELAQLGIVVCVFPLLWAAAKRGYYERTLARPLSLSVAALGALWFVKRAFVLEFWPWLGG
jgi:hydrogenase/urease accessory protein HupE